MAFWPLPMLKMFRCKFSLFPFWSEQFFCFEKFSWTSSYSQFNFQVSSLNAK